MGIIKINDDKSPTGVITQKKVFNDLCSTHGRRDLRFTNYELTGDRSRKVMSRMVAAYNELGAGITNETALLGGTPPAVFRRLQQIHNSLDSPDFFDAWENVDMDTFTLQTGGFDGDGTGGGVWFQEARVTNEFYWADGQDIKITLDEIESDTNGFVVVTMHDDYVWGELNTAAVAENTAGQEFIINNDVGVGDVPLIHVRIQISNNAAAALTKIRNLTIQLLP